MDKNNYLRITRQGLRLASAAAVTCLLAASCSDLTDDAGTALPPGKYPMTFTTQVDGLTVPNPASRATPDNTWNGDEEIALQVGGEVKKYAAATDGSLAVASGNTPFYWQNTSETKTVSAWYPYNDGVRPVTFTVGTDQSDFDDYQKSDLLFSDQITASYSRANLLTFGHLPVKIVVNLTNGAGVTKSPPPPSASSTNPPFRVRLPKMAR